MSTVSTSIISITPNANRRRTRLTMTVPGAAARFADVPFSLGKPY
jgi:hypothetical protein